MKFYYCAILSITSFLLWGSDVSVVAHRDASMRSMYTSSNTQFFPQTGDFSVVVLGEENSAPGKFCNVNGGKLNQAGFLEDKQFRKYAVIGGGTENAAGPTFSTITGGRENFISGEDQRFSTISGGDSNGISPELFASVITGGTENRMCGGFEINKEYCTISGGDSNGCSALCGVATGGRKNIALNAASVAIGGIGNVGNGISATSLGGENNFIGGAFSIGLGIGTKVLDDSSMVINLNVPPGQTSDTETDTDGRGQFIVKAESFTFQVGNNNDGLSIQITKDSIKNLINALENAA
jgi:hypothetical protein